MGLIPPTYPGQPKTEVQKFEEKYGKIYWSFMGFLTVVLYVLVCHLLWKWNNIQAGLG